MFWEYIYLCTPHAKLLRRQKKQILIILVRKKRIISMVERLQQLLLTTEWGIKLVMCELWIWLTVSDSTTLLQKAVLFMKHLLLTTARGCIISSIALLGLLLDLHGYTFENLSINIIMGATSVTCTRWYTHMHRQQYLCIFQEHLLFSCLAAHSRLQSTPYFH